MKGSRQYVIAFSALSNRRFDRLQAANDKPSRFSGRSVRCILDLRESAPFGCAGPPIPMMKKKRRGMTHKQRTYSFIMQLPFIISVYKCSASPVSACLRLNKSRCAEAGCSRHSARRYRGDRLHHASAYTCGAPSRRIAFKRSAVGRARLHNPKRPS